jgi:hypothetical protein
MQSGAHRQLGIGAPRDRSASVTLLNPVGYVRGRNEVTGWS